MIKKVKTINLTPGVYIHDFNCDWNGETIFIEPGLVKDQSIIKILHSWGIQEVYIDTSKGKNIREEQSKPELLRDHKQFGDKLNLDQSQIRKNQVPIHKEVKQAKAILKTAATVIQKTLKQVRTGQTPDVTFAYEVVKEMRNSILRNRDALILLTRMKKKDEYTLYHSISVSSLVLGLCGNLTISEKKSLDIAVGALFHDIGKAIIPLSILNKPGKLTTSEFNQMKKHTEYSVDLLRRVQGLPMECYDIALHHHERIDGSGYPHGLNAEQLPYSTQLVSICDVYDAITSQRCYKDKVGPVSGLQIMYEMAGTHFTKDTLYNFIRFIGVYPVGSHVETSDEKIGVVISSNDDMLKPMVKIYYDKRSGEKVVPYISDLSATSETVIRYAATT